MLDISLLQMKYVMEIYKAGSISKAAKNLYMNQPNLSRAVKELEKTLGIVIFIRTPKGIILSKEGKLFLEYAKSIFHKLEELEEQLRDQKENNVSFNISIPRATYITYAFTKFIQEIHSTSEIKINYSETNNIDAVDNILYNGFELGIIRYTQPYETDIEKSLTKQNLSFKEIWESKYLLLMSKNHPLAQKESITLEDLDEYTELVHGDEDFNKMNPHGSRHKKIYLYERGSQFDLLRNVPTTYMWVSPIPQYILQNNDLIQRRCSNNNICFRDMLIYRKDYQFSHFASRFISMLQQVKEETYMAAYNEDHESVL